jgi:hypothetical protein
MEEQVVAPPRVALHPLRVAEARPVSVAVDQEDRHQALPEIGDDDVKRDVGSRPGRVLDGQFVAEEFVVALQRGPDEVVQRKPHRTPPIRVAAEHGGGRLGRFVVDSRAHTLHVQFVRMIAVVRRQRAKAVRRQEFRRIEQGLTEPPHPVQAGHPDQEPPFARFAAQDACVDHFLGPP